MKTARTLELSLKICDDDSLEVDIQEPVSGTIDRLLFSYSPDEHPEFDQFIGDQIYNWLQMWQEEE